MATVCKLRIPSQGLCEELKQLWGFCGCRHSKVQDDSVKLFQGPNLLKGSGSRVDPSTFENFFWQAIFKVLSWAEFLAFQVLSALVRLSVLSAFFWHHLVFDKLSMTRENHFWRRIKLTRDRSPRRLTTPLYSKFLIRADHSKIRAY